MPATNGHDDQRGVLKEGGTVTGQPPGAATGQALGTATGLAPGQSRLSMDRHFVSQDQDSRHRGMAEDDFPFAWTDLDATFDMYLNFAIEKSLAKFPKQTRREVQP